MNWLLLSALLFSSYLSAEEKELLVSHQANVKHTANRILFLMHTGHTGQALEAYQTYVSETGQHDFDLLEQLGLILLDQGFRTKDPETQLMTLFGAGVSTNEKTLYILEDAVTGRQEPQLELIALRFLAGYHSDRADQILLQTMASDFLLIRLEAALELASKKDPRLVRHMEALMAKVPEMIWPIFPQLFALLDTPEAKKILRKLLAHSDESVRVAAINSIAQNGHDDFLPVIKRLASHHEPIQQEACAAAFGVFQDQSSIPRLLELAKSPHSHIQLTALKALYDLGKTDAHKDIEKLARKQDLFAITLLGKIKGSESILLELVKSTQLQVCMNAALALLELKNSFCLPAIAELLLNANRDYGILQLSSPGKGLTAWKIIPSARQNFEEDPESQEMSLQYRESVLAKTIELPEKDFIYLADLVFDRQLNDLVPVLAELLQNHPTSAVIELLKKYQLKAGAPLVRNYCNLTLYSLKQAGPYRDNLASWVAKQKDIDLISFRPLKPLDTRENGLNRFSLTPKEASRLLIGIFEAFVSTQDDKGVNLLISIIQNGNPKNKYALIGLLLRAIQ